MVEMGRAFIPLLVICAFFLDVKGQESVFVETLKDEGRGILKTRGEECFAIIPHHIIKLPDGSEYNGPISIYGEGSVKSSAEFLKSYIGDLAILRFNGGSDQYCSKWDVDKEYAQVVDALTTGTLEMREHSGGVTTMNVNVTAIDDQYISVRPTNFREDISKGMSGSSLFTEYNGRKVFLGMLQEVDDGEGQILMADEMDKILSDFFMPMRKSARDIEYSGLGIERESLGFRFVLTDVERSGDLVNMKFQVTSLNEDKTLRLYYRDLKLYDQSGVETAASNILIGSQSGGSVKYNLVHGISVPLEISFKGVSSSATNVSLLKINFSDSRTERAFEIRDLELEGSTGDVVGTRATSSSGVESSIHGFKFDLLHISKSGQQVVCKLNITSLDRDKEISMYYRNIFLYDNSGLENNARKITIGNQNGGSLRYNMVHGIAIPVEIVFENVSSSAESIALLKIGFQAEGREAHFEARGLSFDGAGSLGEGSSSCSELYFYRLSSFMTCDEQVIVTNHGEELFRMKPGTRFKTVVCDPTGLKLAAKIKRDEISFTVVNMITEPGKNHYFKVGCTLSVATVAEKDVSTGKTELNNEKKFKDKVKLFQL